MAALHSFTRTLARGFLAAALAAGLAACAPGPYANPVQALAELQKEPLDTQPWEFAGAPGALIQTKHYRIFTTVRDPLYQRLLAKLLEATYQRASTLQPPLRATATMDCYVFGNRAQWELYTRLRAGSNAPVYLQITAGGYCQDGIFAGYHIGREKTLSVIAHEAWHQYSWYTFRDRLPSWLEEGLATQNEAIEWEGVTPKFAPEKNYNRFLALKDAVKENRLLSLQDLTRTHAGQVIKLSERQVGAYYAQLWSLVLFLQNSKYRIALLQMLDDARGGRLARAADGLGLTEEEIRGYTERWNTLAGPAYLRRYIQPDDAKLQAEYQAFLQKFLAGSTPRLP